MFGLNPCNFPSIRNQRDLYWLIRTDLRLLKFLPGPRLPLLSSGCVTLCDGSGKNYSAKLLDIARVEPDGTERAPSESSRLTR